MFQHVSISFLFNFISEQSSTVIPRKDFFYLWTFDPRRFVHLYESKKKKRKICIYIYFFFQLPTFNTYLKITYVTSYFTIKSSIGRPNRFFVCLNYFISFGLLPMADLLQWRVHLIYTCSNDTTVKRSHLNLPIK